MNGAQARYRSHGLREAVVLRGAVGERWTLGRRATETTPGRCPSDDAGISSDKVSENLTRRKPKDSWARQIRPGLVGP